LARALKQKGVKPTGHKTSPECVTLHVEYTAQCFKQSVGASR